MKFRISSEYGVLEEVRSGKHTGIDLAMPEGTTLRSLVDGTVEQIFNDPDGIGKGVKIVADNGKEFIYGHMSDIDVKVGEKISVREIIGESGNTGNSTGPHLHFGVKDNGEFIDPTVYNYRLQRITGDIKEPGFFDIEEKISIAIDDKMMMLRENSSDILESVFEVVGESLLEVMGAVSLIGAGILIILRIVGYEKGYKQAGILLTLNALLRYIFGGS